jgi:site-specific DNA-methyltransferase (adenine-specific)
MYSSKKMDWETPQDLFDKLNQEFNFVLDAAATEENAKCDAYMSNEDGDDSLTVSWHHHSALTSCEVGRGAIWLNPPYGRGIGVWVQKARRTSLQGTTVVCLLPSRTDVAWWHDYIWDRDNDCPQGGVEVRFIKGRLKFGGSKNSAPFPSVVVIFHGRAR